MQSALPFSAGGAAERPPARVLARPAGSVSQPRAAPAAAGLGRLDHRHLGLRGRARRLRVQPRRRLRRRPDRADPLAAGRDRLALHRDSRRPLPARARDARLRPAARGRARDDVRLRADGRPDRRRLRAGGHGRRDQHGLPARPGRASALAGEDTRGADRRERQLEHDREPRLLRRAGPRRPPARVLERLGRLHVHGGAVPLLGADAGAAAAHHRAAVEPRAPAPGGRGDGRLPRDRARSETAPRRRALLGADARERSLRRADRGLGPAAARPRRGRRRLPERGRRRRRDHRRTRLARARRAQAAGDDVRDRGRRDRWPAVAARRDPDHRGGARRPSG